jgi:alpha/beta hydrolase fold
MDAAGSDRATIYGWSEGGQLSLMLAATHPERVSGLVLYGSYASIDVTREQYEGFLETLEKHWGEGVLVGVNAPSRRKDEAFVQWFGRLERAVASPGAILALMRANYEIDVRQLLPSIHVPTLILHRERDSLVPVASGRYLAEHIPGAKYVELPGVDHLLQALDQDLLDVLLDEVEAFVTGTPRRPRGERMLAEHLPAEANGTEWRGADDALAELERCREILACGEDGPGLAGLVARAEALAAAARGSWSEAEAQFVKAAETFRRHGMVWQEAHTFQSWGSALRAGTDRGAAIEKLDLAIEIYRRHAASHGSLDSATGTVPAPASTAVFRQEGDYWTVSWAGNVIRLKHTKGVHYIAYLLAHPGRQVLASDLAAVGPARGAQRAGVEPGGTAADLGDAGAVLDAKAREQYRRRIAELREALGEATRFNDTFRAAGLRSELEALRDQLAGAVGLGGRNRKAASHTERARLMVTKAIKAALAKIRAMDASLGRHLATSIKTGTCCAYDPGPLPPVSWQL